jgi:hypothetical protein
VGIFNQHEDLDNSSPAIPIPGEVHNLLDHGLGLRIGTTEYAALLRILLTAHCVATDGASVDSFELSGLFPQKAGILSIEDARLPRPGFGMLAISMKSIRLILPKYAGRHLYHLFKGE